MFVLLGSFLVLTGHLDLEALQGDCSGRGEIQEQYLVLASELSGLMLTGRKCWGLFCDNDKT